MRRKGLPWRILLWSLVVLCGCGGTRTDDEENFSRVFGFSKPTDVKVMHSYYWKSPHRSGEYRYYIALQVPPKFATGLTSSQLVTAVVDDRTVLDACGDKPPQWFLPKSVANYQAWIPKGGAGYRVFRDRADGTLFLCDERL